MPVKTLHIKLGFILFFVLSFVKTVSGRNNVGVKNDLSQVNDTLMVSNVYFIGNEKTKEKIIRNELLFSTNSKVAKADVLSLIDKSRQNLLNTSLFNFVYIDFWSDRPDEINFQVKVQERWYLWALPLFEQADRNFSAFIDNGDWSRVNYGVYLKQENFRGLNQLLNLKLRIGFLNEIKLKFNTAEINNKLSWGANIAYQTKKQISYGIIDNKPVYAKTVNSFISKSFFNELFLTYRHNFTNRHKLALGYKSYNINDSLATLNPEFLLNGNTTLKFLTLGYRYKLDLRDSKSYPLNGFLFYGHITRSGLGIIDNSVNNTSFNITFRNHGGIYKRFKYGWTFNGIINSNKNTPFIVSSGLGYKEFLNGYEYNVIESDDFAYTKQKVLFELLAPKTKNLNFINVPQFSKIHYALYLKAYFDHGYVHKENPHISNSLSNTYLYSYGFGVDIVTYYDKVFSINYSINKQGIKGLYFHLNLGM